jgi:hypothetical protein
MIDMNMPAENTTATAACGDGRRLTVASRLATVMDMHARVAIDFTHRTSVAARPPTRRVAGRGMLGQVEEVTRAIELLAWRGCPSYPVAKRQLRGILADLGLTDVQVAHSWIEDDETAVARRFVGSPTFRVDDEDLIPVDANDVYGLTCRVYLLADGRYSPTPDPEELRRAVAARFLNP